MSDELKGAVGVALFGFTIAAIAWLLPIGSGAGRSLIAKQDPPQESPTSGPKSGNPKSGDPRARDTLNPIRALGASPGTKPRRCTQSTEHESKQQSPIPTRTAAPQDQPTAAQSSTRGLHIEFRKTNSGNAGSHLAVHVVNGSDTLCEGLCVHVVAGLEAIDEHNLPAGCARRSLGGESLSCTLVDLDAGEQTTLLLPLHAQESPAEIVRVKLFGWLGGAATFRTAVCELGDDPRR